MMTSWKCPLCSDTSHYNGLCRVCTEYDSGGSVKEAVQRERINEDGSSYVKVERRIEPMEMAQMKAKFVEQRRRQLTKRQKALVAEEAKALKEAQAEVASQADEEGMLEIGENVSEEE